jgi:hypothetical protein
MKSLLAFLLIVPMFAAYTAPKTQTRVQTFVVRGPTVIAFFVPENPNHADEDEALDDFQWYAMQSSKRMKAAGIEFHVVSARSFRVSVLGKTQVFTAKESVGYYLVAPGKKARVEYGVITDDDLMEVARSTFGTVRK